MPEGAVYVGRPSRWGNPFEVRPAESRKGGPKDMWGVWLAGVLLVRWDARELAASEAVARFRQSIIVEQHWRTPTLAGICTHLSGRDLACWCPLDQPCHADVLLAIANVEPAVS